MADAGKELIACVQTDMSEKIRTSVPAEISNSTRGKMDLSLLPSRKASDLLPTPKSTARPQLSPYPGLCLLLGSPNVSSFRSPSQMKQQQHSQLTIFYGGKVNTYNVTSDTAKAIMAIASSGVNHTTSPANLTRLAPTTPNPTNVISSTPTPKSPLSIVTGNLQHSRKHSLQRFLEKRSGRLQARAPYANPNATSANAHLRQN